MRRSSLGTRPFMLLGRSEGHDTLLILGELWHQLDGLRHDVRACSCSQRSGGSLIQRQFPTVLQAFTASKEQSLTILHRLSTRLANSLAGERCLLETYFTRLHYDFGAESKQGLTLYFRYAKQLGLLDA